ncbi:hypothetical protein GCM10011515_09200 [Tsuneonella deserti]|uniref:YdhG-like domain-containing protein n=1 Tax=Tsuneonella deserti TaxID=2035528 RepID=A0ABQ1S3X4_9SPHN|nr:YdeI/OmpD-associated family protein [Tsuneonella deserti]GGD91677.1 hypothetical protein GCM10011515_09200 [Tsuneonella deserti]
MKTDPRIDAYIANAAEFARPILTRLRALVHSALPQAEETIKWSMPHFTVLGKNVAGMAAFKAHCAFTIHGEGRAGTEGMGQHGKLASVEDIPPDAELVAKLIAATARIESDGSATKARSRSAPKTEIPMPEDFAAALAGNPQARATLEGFAPSHRREYVQWVTEAKREETRAKRIAQSVEWLAEGKKRNWKYERC